MSLRFKVGDRVVVVRDDYDAKRIGHTGTVVGAYEGVQKYPYMVQYDDMSDISYAERYGDGLMQGDHELELLNPVAAALPVQESDPSAGVWVWRSTPYEEPAVIPFQTEIEALRQLNDRGEGRVLFVPFGQDVYEVRSNA